MKKMKRLLAILILLVIVLLVWKHISVNRMRSPDDFIPLIQRTLRTEAPLTVLGDYDNNLNDTRLLLCYTTDFRGRADFYAVRLEKGWLQYQCHIMPSLVERGPDLYHVMWGNGYVLISDNPEAAYLELKSPTPAGETVQIPVTSVPFAYYWDWSAEPWLTDATSYSYEYLFYNHAGEPLEN